MERLSNLLTFVDNAKGEKFKNDNVYFIQPEVLFCSPPKMPAKPPFVLDTENISDEALEIARIELRETPENRAKAVKELQELLKNSPDLYYRDDEEFLLIYLRPCKFYAESAFQLMKQIAEFRKKYSNLLDNLMPDDERNSFENHNVVNVLTNRDHKGRRVMIVNAGKTWNPKAVPSDSLFRIFYLIHEAALLEPETQIRGVVVIMDFDGLSMSQITALSPAFSMKLLGFIQKAMPLRLKEVHMVKQPWLFKMVWAIFKPFIEEKLAKRIFFHGGDMKSLHKHMDPSHLPEDYGGKLPKIDYTGKDWFPVIKDYEEHIQNLNSYGFVEKK